MIQFFSDRSLHKFVTNTDVSWRHIVLTLQGRLKMRTTCRL